MLSAIALKSFIKWLLKNYCCCLSCLRVLVGEGLMLLLLQLGPRELEMLEQLYEKDRVVCCLLYLSIFTRLFWVFRSFLCDCLNSFIYLWSLRSFASNEVDLTLKELFEMLTLLTLDCKCCSSCLELCLHCLEWHWQGQRLQGCCCWRRKRCWNRNLCCLLTLFYRWHVCDFLRLLIERSYCCL